MKPAIGVTLHTDQGMAGDLFPGHPLYYVEHHYIEAIHRHGMRPVLLPVIQDLSHMEYLAGSLDGLMLTGGGFLPLQTETDHTLPGLKGTGEERFAFEQTLLRFILPTGMPVLGICRGCQMINDVHGGTLYNLEGTTNIEHHQEKRGIPGDQATHAIRLARDSKLASWLGTSELPVNSFHRQAISRLGNGLRPTGWSVEDDVIETIEGTEHPWLIGLQFHPEKLWREDARWSGLYDALRHAAFRYSNAKQTPSRR